MYVFSDRCPRQKNTVLDHSTFLDDTAASDNGILDGTLDGAAIGYNGRLHIRSLIILCRAGVIGSCIDRPFIVKQSRGILQVDQLNISIIVTLKVCDGSKISSV